ncbi:hypothetical protein FA13DRAFT_1748494, partial [Coprinellus micaceus]
DQLNKILDVFGSPFPGSPEERIVRKIGSDKHTSGPCPSKKTIPFRRLLPTADSEGFQQFILGRRLIANYSSSPRRNVEDACVRPLGQNRCFPGA